MARVGFSTLHDRHDDEHFRLLREWMWQCNSTHDHRRKEPYPRNQQWQLPKRLLYVGSAEEEDADLSIVSTEHSPKPYIAVSHRWGDSDRNHQTTTKNIEEHDSLLQDTDVLGMRGWHCLRVRPEVSAVSTPHLIDKMSNGTVGTNNL